MCVKPNNKRKSFQNSGGARLGSREAHDVSNIRAEHLTMSEAIFPEVFLKRRVYV